MAAVDALAAYRAARAAMARPGMYAGPQGERTPEQWRFDAFRALLDGGPGVALPNALLGTIRQRAGEYLLEGPDGIAEPLPYAFRAYFGPPLAVDVGRRVYRRTWGLEMESLEQRDARP